MRVRRCYFVVIAERPVLSPTGGSPYVRESVRGVQACCMRASDLPLPQLPQFSAGESGKCRCRLMDTIPPGGRQQGLQLQSNCKSHPQCLFLGGYSQ